MGTGKSSVGRRLAERLGLKYADTDDLVEARAGMTIKDIFGRFGETRFRRLEKEVIDGIISSSDGLVLSTGGGAVADDSTRRSLRSWGTVVCLTADVETILKRVGSGDERPLLDGADKREEAEALLKKREAAYRDSDLMVDTSKNGAEEVIEKIVRFLSSPRPGKGGSP